MKFIDNIKKLSKSTHYITIPAELLREEKLKKGDYVEVTIKKAEVVVEK